jgi:hypothetical protein
MWVMVGCWTGFSREGCMAADDNMLNVLAFSRLKPVPRGKWNPVGANLLARRFT